MKKYSKKERSMLAGMEKSATFAHAIRNGS